VRPGCSSAATRPRRCGETPADRLGRLERAEKAIARDRSNGNALGAGVAALAALDEPDRAKDWMRRALLIDPDNLLMRYNFGRTLATSLGDPEAALGMLGRSWSGTPAGW